MACKKDRSWTSLFIWTPCFSILFFQFTNRRPRGVTPDPIVVQGHVVPHLKALMYGYLEPEAQERGSPFTMYHALSKIGVL